MRRLYRVVLKRCPVVGGRWSMQLQGATETHRLRRREYPLLIFFHGDSLAHTIRPLMMARSLRERGYPVVFAGTGVHQSRILAEGTASP